MAKISSVVRFSDHYKLDKQVLTKLGVLDVTLNIDTALFIDPLLIIESCHPEISDGARKTYEQHFATIIKLLKASKVDGDMPWRNAKRLMSFPEITWTCLGYGGNSTSGSGSGNNTTDHVIQTAKQIVDLGVDDPDLFVAMALFEEGIGPDRISDMTTNVIAKDLLDFNVRVQTSLGIETEEFELQLKNGNTFRVKLTANPYSKNHVPILLVPTDIVRDLPIAKDWSDVADAASKNAALRQSVNKQIANLWKVKTLKDKDQIKRWALSSQEQFENFMEMLRSVTPESYDVAKDPAGKLLWAEVAQTIASQEPRKIKLPKVMDVEGVKAVVQEIIDQFQFLIESRRFSEMLYIDGKKPRNEKAAQMLFFAVALSYCQANNLDITPEADTHNGPVDFKLSHGMNGRVLVEIKLSTNGKVVQGYTRQLERYKEAEQTTCGYYVLLDVGKMGNKLKKLLNEKNKLASAGEKVSELICIDGTKRLSASKL